VKRIIKGCLIVIGSIVILWLCYPFLIGLLFHVTSRLQYDSEEPHPYSSIILPDTDIQLTLWSKQRPRAIFYEGHYRVLEVKRPAHDVQFYTLAPYFPGDQLNLQVFWLPDRQTIRLKYKETPCGPDESFIDLTAGTITHVRRGGDGTIFATSPYLSSTNLIFPPPDARWSFCYTDSDNPVIQKMSSNNPYHWEFLKSAEQSHVAPTGGLFVDMLEGELEPVNNTDTSQD